MFHYQRFQVWFSLPQQTLHLTSRFLYAWIRRSKLREFARPLCIPNESRWIFFSAAKQTARPSTAEFISRRQKWRFIKVKWHPLVRAVVYFGCRLAIWNIWKALSALRFDGERFESPRRKKSHIMNETDSPNMALIQIIPVFSVALA